MRHLAPPDAKAVDTYNLTLSRMKAGDLHRRMVEATNQIDDASKRYIAAALAGGLAAEPTFNLTDVSEEEMAEHYAGRFVKKSSAGRPVYDEIRLRARICPMCGHRTVATLDHFWPKRPHSALAVNPANLVPCCHDCNVIKNNFQPSCRAEELLHPYFDDLGDDSWLQAEVVDSGGHPVVLFSPQPPPGWPEETTRRVVHHFRLFDLANLYAMQAATELVAIAHEVADVFQNAGNAGVRAHLSLRADSYGKAQPNSWQTAMYRALADSVAYCGGWFS